jgi:methyl-accepting chemotaxis protein
MIGAITALETSLMFVIIAKYGRGLLSRIFLWILIPCGILGTITFWVGSVGLSLWTIGINVIVMIPVSVWIVMLVQRNITHPIQDLIQLSQKLALGDLNQEISLKYKDELGQLALAIGDMAAYQKEIAILTNCLII